MILFVKNNHGFLQNKLKLLFIFIFIFNAEYKDLLQIYKRNDNIKIALCTMGKDENLYANEFIEYYIKLGVNQLFIYDDNDDNKERIYDIMDKKYQKYVTIYETKKFHINNQTAAFTECYNNNKDKFDWFLMLDMDEYLYKI